MISSLFLVHFSSAGHDGPAQTVDEYAFTILVDETWIPSNIDMNFSVIKSIKNYSASFTAVLNSLEVKNREFREQLRHSTEIERKSEMITI
jgi:hypothetical protein